METFLELGVLNYFSIIFPALLVFVIVFAILEKTKMLGESKSIHAIAAICAAFLVMLSKDILSIISFGAPWFVLVFVFLVLLLMIYRFMGASEADISYVITKDRPIQWTIFIIAIIIIIASISNVYGQRLLEKAQGEGLTIEEYKEKEEAEGRTFRGELHNTIFNAKILGMMLMFLIAVFTISLLSRESIAH
ncbi:hypothetical protein GOV06_05110 [Candidatus Woesearchaeota archaeon]|nr:hypothetical protein [Candidatus Woesearchaeota archaeon]